APSLSAAWSPALLHGTKFSAGWGIYFETVPLRLLALNQEQSSVTTFFSASGAPVGLPVQSSFEFDRRDVRMPRDQVASLSVEHMLPGHVYTRVNLKSREGSRGLSFNSVMLNP